jgi:uncharacterized protein (TIGR03435 family)
VEALSKAGSSWSKWGKTGANIVSMLGTCLMLTVGPAAEAQTSRDESRDGASKLTQFEVATIKPRDPAVMETVGVKIYAGGRVVIRAVPLKTLISTAFHLPLWQISGTDGWMVKDEYNLEAKAPEKSLSSIKSLRYSWFGIEDPRLREMLQALLIDRFQLKFHRETKIGNVYTLQRSGKPLALRQNVTAPARDSHADNNADNNDEPQSFGGNMGYAGGWSIFNMTMAQVARFASDYVLRAPVVDGTGLSGSYDYRQRPTPPEEERENDHDASFLRLIAEVGLKLEVAKGPVEMFVIDGAARPSSN